MCVRERRTCPVRARGRCGGLQRAWEGTDGGSSWMGTSSRSSMRGFLMLDSGLVSGVTLFLRIRVPGPLLTSCRARNAAFGPGAKPLQPLLNNGLSDAAVAFTSGPQNQSHLWSVSVGVHRLHIQVDGLHFAPIGDRSELQHRVEGTLQVGHLVWNKRSEEKHLSTAEAECHKAG